MSSRKAVTLAGQAAPVSWRRRSVQSASAPRTDASIGSMPPRENSASAAAPRTTWMDARFLVPASVRTSVPPGKSNSASISRRFGLGFFTAHCSRPATMRWITRKRSSSKANTSRLPMRLSPVTRLPTIADTGGSTLRTTNGLTTVTAEQGAPENRAVSASR